MYNKVEAACSFSISILSYSIALGRLIAEGFQSCLCSEDEPKLLRYVLNPLEIHAAFTALD